MNLRKAAMYFPSVVDAPLLLRAEPVFSVAAIKQDNDTFTPFEDCVVTVAITCNLPVPIQCDSVFLSLIHDKKHRKPVIKTTSAVSQDGAATDLDMCALYEVKKESHGTVFSSRMDCHTPLRRTDSGVSETLLCKDNYTLALKADKVCLVPGANDVTLTAKVGETPTHQCWFKLLVAFKTVQICLEVH